MRRKHKLPISSARGADEINISDACWCRLEHIYKCALPPVIRRQVSDATQSYVQSAQLEVNAQSLDEVEKKLSRVMKAAREFWHVALEETEGGADTAFYVKHLVGKNLLDSRIPDDMRKFNFVVCEIMTEFVSACTMAAKELDELKAAPNGRQDGRSWDEWIRRLTAIARTNGLSTSARKDSDKRRPDSGSSPFVDFIGELQSCVPEGQRRHTHSKGALVQAIFKARKLRVAKPSGRTF